MNERLRLREEKRMNSPFYVCYWCWCWWMIRDDDGSRGAVTTPPNQPPQLKTKTMNAVCECWWSGVKSKSHNKQSNYHRLHLHNNHLFLFSSDAGIWKKVNDGNQFRSEFGFGFLLHNKNERNWLELLSQLLLELEVHSKVNKTCFPYLEEGKGHTSRPPNFTFYVRIKPDPYLFPFAPFQFWLIRQRWGDEVVRSSILWIYLLHPTLATTLTKIRRNWRSDFNPEYWRRKMDPLGLRFGIAALISNRKKVCFSEKHFWLLTALLATPFYACCWFGIGMGCGSCKWKWNRNRKRMPKYFRTGWVAKRGWGTSSQDKNGWRKAETSETEFGVSEGRGGGEGGNEKRV